jgi:carboxymethylenebutenolidase
MQMITYKRPDGKDTPGYYVPAADPEAPCVVVIQEWWGLNDQIKGVAARFAEAGYHALVPDLYRGKQTVEAKEAEHLAQKLNFADAAAQDIRGAVQHLKSQDRKVGVNGFCMGGALALLAAASVQEADAVVTWYGFPPLQAVDARAIKCPLMGHFAVHDEFFPIATVEELERKLWSAGVPFQFHRYAARHAFANENAVNAPIPIEYDKDAAELAWSRTMAFFTANLSR